MFDLLVGMKADLEMLKTAFGNSLRIGPVAKVDAEKGYRLQLGGTDSEPFLSPWYPHPETGKTSVPLKMGQIVGVMNPAGDPRQGMVFRAGYSDDNPSPNADMEANVFEDAGVRVEIKGGELLISVEGVTYRFSGNGFEQMGGTVQHNGTNIGDTHVHGGVLKGGADTDRPH